jgi:hypothetical protein
VCNLLDEGHDAIEVAGPDEPEAEGERVRRPGDGDDAAPEHVEPIIVSETIITVMFGLEADEEMRLRTEAIIGNLILSFATAWAWTDEDETMTPREAFEKYVGERIDALSEAGDEDARAAAVRAVKQHLRDARGHLEVQGKENEAFGGGMPIAASDEDITAAGADRVPQQDADADAAGNRDQVRDHPRTGASDPDGERYPSEVASTGGLHKG